MSTAIEIKERPILFSAPMVKAILAGRKTMTRRIVKPQISTFCSVSKAPLELITSHEKKRHRAITCPYGKPGDILYVKEALIKDEVGFADYADGSPVVKDGDFFAWPWKIKHLTGRYMPRWASRITLEITDVRVERLQDISEADAIAEGAMDWSQTPGCLDSNQMLNKWCRASAAIATARDEPRPKTATALGAFCCLWGKINGPDSWAANPFVWVVSFKRVEAN